MQAKLKTENLTSKQAAVHSLREMVKKDDIIHCVLRHVSSSGMTRRISFFVIKDNKPLCLDYLISELGTYKRSNKDGLTVGGCGMDMGFAVVYNTAAQIFADESKGDAGYSLTHRWL